MNFLAHAYLSFNRDEILVGNMISDFVKGIQQYHYDEKIRKGIKFHRLIDSFTDEHTVTKEAAKVFRPAVGLYSRAFVDVVYDHFLSLDENELSEKEWLDFSFNTYRVLFKYNDILPKPFAGMLPNMSEHNWLYHYRFKFGIYNSFKGLVKRAKYLENSEPAYFAFENNYDFLKDCYRRFFPNVKAFAFRQVQIMVDEI